MAQCKYCGKKGLKWRVYDDKPVLTVKLSGIQHKCPQRPKKVLKQKTVQLSLL